MPALIGGFGDTKNYKNYKIRMKNNNEKLNPYFIVGFVDAEASFIISIFKNNKYKTG
jgi:hypothetical protein